MTLTAEAHLEGREAGVRVVADMEGSLMSLRLCLSLEASRQLRRELEEAELTVLKVAEHMSEVPADLSVTYAWECQGSPIGYCVYDTKEDLAHDACVYCGLPEERK